MIAWPRRNPPNERATRLSQEERLLGVARRDQPEQEGHDHVPIDDHVQRQDEDDQQVADRPEAGHRELTATGPTSWLGDTWSMLSRTAVICVDEVHLAKADRRSASACHGATIDGRSLAELGTSRRTARIDVARAWATTSTSTTRTTTMSV